MMKKFYGIFIMLIVAQLTFAQKVTVPQLSSPENEFETAMPNAILDWDAVSGIGEIAYHVQLATDESFGTLIVDEDMIALSAYYNMNLSFGQQYFWRVKASDDNGSSDWSAVYSFTVFSEGQNDKPSNNKDGIANRPNIKWKKKIDGEFFIGFDGWDVQLDTVETFDSPLSFTYQSGSDDNGELETELIPDYLLFGKTYYWHIRPMHTEDAGTWTDTWNFETVFGTELKKPSNNDSDIEFDQELSWDNLEENDGIFEYTCQISLDEDFSDPVALVTNETKVAPDFYKFGTEYFWRVKAAHPNDVSSWSDVRTFTTVTSIVIKSPENGTSVPNYRPVLKWEDIKAVEGYQIRISKNADMSEAVYHLAVGSSTDEYPLNTLDSSMYYWSVRAYNGNDTCDWAENYSFNTMSVGINELENVKDVTVYPNPVINSVTIEFVVQDNALLQLSVSNILGKTIIEENIDVMPGSFKKSFDVSELNSGIYFIVIKQGDQNIAKKFVIK